MTPTLQKVEYEKDLERDENRLDLLKWILLVNSAKHRTFVAALT